MAACEIYAATAFLNVPVRYVTCYVSVALAVVCGETVSLACHISGVLVKYVSFDSLDNLWLHGRTSRAQKPHTTQRCDTARAQCSRFTTRFTGIGPEAESNRVTLRIKYGKIPKKTGISPDPASESKVGYIPPFWHATVARPRDHCLSTVW